VIAVATAAALFVPAVSSATATTSTSSAKPTIVLVHGGFADGSNWNGVIQKLQGQGYPTIAPANPLRPPRSAACRPTRRTSPAS
jgi:pimeloyl-ACP methyl ester carboxylesterase